MCIGVPLQVLVAEPGQTWCEADGQGEWLDMALIGPQPPGTWVLAFQGAARQVMGEAEAQQARAGRQALAAVLRGETDVDAYFTDLVGRPPELPEHLRRSPETPP
jgi:hydrogenase expression/formation protein HypC